MKVKYDDRSGDNIVEKIAYAKKVIVTVPHGVLSKNADQGGIKFRPLLPYKTRQVRAFVDILCFFIIPITYTL